MSRTALGYGLMSVSAKRKPLAGPGVPSGRLRVRVVNPLRSKLPTRRPFSRTCGNR